MARPSAMPAAAAVAACGENIVTAAARLHDRTSSANISLLGGVDSDNPNAPQAPISNDAASVTMRDLCATPAIASSSGTRQRRRTASLKRTVTNTTASIV